MMSEPSQPQADPTAVLRAMPPEVMTTEEVAQYLNLTTATLFQWRKDGEGPKYCKINSRTIRYLRADVIDYVRGYRA